MLEVIGLLDVYMPPGGITATLSFRAQRDISFCEAMLLMSEPDILCSQNIGLIAHFAVRVALEQRTDALRFESI